MPTFTPVSELSRSVISRRTIKQLVRIPAADPAYVPAQVGGENVNALVLGEKRVESAAVRPVDGVAHVGRPEGQPAAVEQMIVLLPSLKFFLSVSLFVGAAFGAWKICTLAASGAIISILMEANLTSLMALLSDAKVFVFQGAGT